MLLPLGILDPFHHRHSNVAEEDSTWNMDNPLNKLLFVINRDMERVDPWWSKGCSGRCHEGLKPISYVCSIIRHAVMMTNLFILRDVPCLVVHGVSVLC